MIRTNGLTPIHLMVAERSRSHRGRRRMHRDHSRSVRPFDSRATRRNDLRDGIVEGCVFGVVEPEIGDISETGEGICDEAE